ncbi:MAG: 4a-hydroxytetrahydrobiopterin dehydratase [Ilumatobacteraceae bacterium]|jgi:4a-hydroxytetrahydrobiopterin dehydratase
MFEEVNGKLSSKFVFNDFDEAMSFVNAVAKVANEHDHHPDISISWNTVVVECCTHSAGGVITDLDHSLAEAITQLEEVGR